MKRASFILVVLLAFGFCNFCEGQGKDTVNTIAKKEIDKPVAFVDVEQQPEFPGGMNAFLKYTTDSIKYPTSAQEKSIQGRVYIQFIINKDGSISDVKIQKGIGGGCDEEAIRLIKDMPNWIPGKQNGKIVAVRHTLPVKFTCTNCEMQGKDIGKTNNTSDDSSNNQINPEFPGGMDRMLEYIGKNVKYPDSAQKKGIEGKVYVSFVIDKNGSVIDVKVLKGIGGGCDEEAALVIKNMPQWKPGKAKGKNVAVRYTLPIKFTLTTNNIKATKP